MMNEEVVVFPLERCCKCHRSDSTDVDETRNRDGVYINTVYCRKCEEETRRSLSENQDRRLTQIA